MFRKRKEKNHGLTHVTNPDRFLLYTPYFLQVFKVRVWRIMNVYWHGRLNISISNRVKPRILKDKTFKFRVWRSVLRGNATTG